MGRGTGSMIENTFGQGLITEATGLNFPKDAATKTENCIFNTTLSVSRRPGISYEESYQTTARALTDVSIYEYQWKNVAGIPTLNFTVLQIGSTVEFCDNDSLQLSNNKKPFSINLNVLKFAGSPDCKTEKVQATQGSGKLYLVHPFCDPIVVVYNPDTNSLDVTQQLVLVRDFDGVVETGNIDARPGALADIHKYNLYNQGWSVSAPTGSDHTTIGAESPVLTAFHAAKGAYPSNVDYWWAAKDGLNQYNTLLIDSTALGNTPAPKGHYIVEAFKTDRQFVSGISSVDLPTINSLYHRPSVISFFAGRLFFTGVNYGSYANKIYFSKIIETDNDIGKCYQQGDPTAEDGSDLLPSDGGVINTLDMGTIYKLFPIGYSLLIFANNGIWSLSGSTGTGFTASDYSISKLSANGVTSADTFIDVNGSPIWWSATSINTLGSSGQNESSTASGSSVQSLTNTTIKTFYNSIPDSSKLWATGAYDRYNNIVYYCYSSTDVNTITKRGQFDRVLTYNTLTKAFGLWTLPSASEVLGIPLLIENSNSQTKMKFFMSIGGNTSFAEFKDVYKDWETHSYISFIETGYAILGQAYTKFQIHYFFLYQKGIDNAVVQFFHKWDYTNNPNLGLWTNPQQCWNQGSNYDYSISRKRIRGSGKSVVMRLESIDDQEFEIAGWAIAVSSNGSP